MRVKQKPFPKGNKAAVIVFLLHMLLIILFLIYVCFVKFPVFLYDDGLFLNRKFISATKDFLISSMEIYVGIPFLLCILNTAVVKYSSMKYLEYIRNIQNLCGNAGDYFQEHYPEQRETIAQTTYFASRIELLQKDAQSLRPEKITKIFSKLRQCGSLEKEFQELTRRCDAFHEAHSEQEFAQMLRHDFRSYLTNSADLLNRCYPEQTKKSLTGIDGYLKAVSAHNITGRYFKENPYDSDTCLMLAQMYEPLAVLAGDLQIIAEYVIQNYPEILAENAVSETEAEPLPEELQKKFSQAQTLLNRIPDSQKLLELSAQKDKKSQKKYLSYLEKFRNYAVVASAYDKCTGLFCECIADTEQLLLQQLLSHYRIIQNAYRMYLPEDSAYPEKFGQTYETLKKKTESGAFIWHLYYLNIFSVTQHRQCDVSLSSHDTQNLQCALDAVRTCAEQINQEVRKDDMT